MLASLALTVALATAAAQERPTPAHTYALIIGNNQSLGLRRPALQYADDDAAKYAELFGTLMPAQNVVLLTEFDRDTERLYPQHAARARQPTCANVEAALDELARRTGEARSQGAQVSFYFIFAGHGDVDEGRGFLELKDAAFTAAATVSLRLPASLARGMSVEQPSEEGVKRSRLGADLTTVALASLSLRQAPEQSRGPGELLEALFSTPFGPQALAALEQERATQPEPVYGLSQEDVSRMSLLVGELGDSERKRRLYGRGIDIAMGSGMLGMGFMTSIAGHLWRADGVVGLIVMSAGTIQLAGSAFLLHRQSEGETLARHFQEKLSTPGYDPAQLVAQTEMQLQLMLNQERKHHRVTQTVSGIYGAMAVGILVINETVAPEEYKYAGRNLGVFLAVVSARMILSTYFEKSSTEQVIRIWQNDPGIKNLPRVSLAPLSGGGMFSLQGTF